MKTLSGKKILLGITGSIAAYKAAELVRLLKEVNIDVRVVMTEAANAFITPLTLQALSGNKVYQTLLDAENEAAMSHIDLARWADLILIAPASAHTLAKISLGLADDLLTTLCLATSAPIIIAPAMNRLMWENPATQQHMSILKQRHIQIWGPGSGSQACGEVGWGRMLEAEEIAEKVQNYFHHDQKQSFAKKIVLITAGPTQEAIDPVRFISNYSSGKMGYALAEAFAKQGAEVILISGPTALNCPAKVNCLSVVTAQQMHDAVMQNISDIDIFISAAAVSDYRVEHFSKQKIKNKLGLDLKLIPNPDILKAVSQLKHRPFIIGFAAETENLIENAKKKLLEKNLDMIIANPVGEKKGIQVDENEITVLTQTTLQHFAKTDKQQIAKQFVNYLIDVFNNIKLPTTVKHPTTTKNK